MASRTFTLLLLVALLALNSVNASPFSTATSNFEEVNRPIASTTLSHLVRSARKIDWLASIVHQTICCHCRCRCGTNWCVCCCACHQLLQRPAQSAVERR